MADVAGLYRRVVSVCPIKVCQVHGGILQGDEAIAARERAPCPFLRKLAGRTVDAVLFKELSRLGHRAARGSRHCWQRSEDGIPRHAAQESRA